MFGPFRMCPAVITPRLALKVAVAVRDRQNLQKRLNGRSGYLLNEVIQALADEDDELGVLKLIHGRWDRRQVNILVDPETLHGEATEQLALTTQKAFAVLRHAQ